MRRYILIIKAHTPEQAKEAVEKKGYTVLHVGPETVHATIRVVAAETGEHPPVNLYEWFAEDLEDPTEKDGYPLGSLLLFREVGGDG